MRYKAFVSYSHAADGKLGPALQSALHRFARPWYQLRAIRVFRDDTNLSVSPALWTSIVEALCDSEFLVLLASPAASASDWVRREVDHWLQEKSADTLLLVVTGGEIAWDGEARDFDWRVTDSLPRNLRGAFAEEPLYIDLRWARSTEDLSLDNPTFLDNVATIAARLHGKDKDALIGEDVRQHRRVKRLTWSAVTILAVVTLFAIAAAYFAWQQKGQAERQTRVAIARYVTAQAELLRDQRASLLPESTHLAVESYERLPSPEAYRVLREGLSLLPRHVWSVAPEKGASLVALSPGGRFLATESGGTIWLRDLVRDTAIGKPLRAPAGRRHRGALTRDGRYLAIGASEGVHLWDATTGAYARLPFRGDRCEHVRGNAIGLSPDDRYLVSAAGNGTTVRVRPIADVLARAGAGRKRIAGRRSGPLYQHEGCVYAVAVSADAEHAATYSLGTRDKVWIWDTARDERRAMVVPHWEVSMLSFGEDGRHLATASPDGTARVWDWGTGREVALARHEEAVRAAVLDADGRHLATVGRDRTVRLWDVDSSREVFRVAGSDAISSIAFDRDRHQLITASFGGSVEAWEIGSALEAMRLEHGMNAGPFTVVLSPDGSRLAVTSSDDRMQLWDLASGTPVLRLDDVRRAALSADGGLLAAVDESGSLRVYVVADGVADGLTRAGAVPVGGVNDITFGAEGRRLATAGEDGTLWIWDAASVRVIRELQAGSPVERVEFDHRRQRWLALTATGVAHWWPAEAEPSAGGSLTINRPAHRWASAISGDGSLVASWTRGEETVQVWDVVTGALSHFAVHFADPDAEPTLAFSIDGEYLAIASSRDPRQREGNVTVVWDVERIAEIARITVDEHVSDLAFSADGKHLATVGYDTASLWLWRPQDLIAEACRRLARYPMDADAWRPYLGDEPPVSCPDRRPPDA